MLSDETMVFDLGRGTILPDEGIMAEGLVPADVYYSRERFAAEQDIFRHNWLNIAEEMELPNPGDWVVRDVRMLSVSVLIVRGKDNRIRAFHNICSHRGMKLVWDDKGRGGKFSCPYHAWLYDATGALTHIPDEGCFPHVDKQESGLSPISCESWEGFVYINLDPRPAQSLIEFLGPMAEAIKDGPFDAFPTHVKVRSTIKANWKLTLEAQTEGYHAAMLHARTVGKMLVSKDNPFKPPALVVRTRTASVAVDPIQPRFRVSQDKARARLRAGQRIADPVRRRWRGGRISPSSRA